MSFARSVVCVVYSVLLLGCDINRKAQLQQVARDWCLTITASQVMPVYPLTEDLQPGDVFLVNMTVEEQRQRFDDKGFLPLDHHLARLTPEGYADFYRDMFVVPAGGTVDYTRYFQRKSTGGANWTAAPHAGFPSYGFSVSRSGGLNIGVPISGVPVGVSLLNADQATGSVTIRDANTVGIDVVTLYGQLNKWAVDNADYLLPYARRIDVNDPKGDRAGPAKAYLRIVSRIFVSQGVDVTVADAKSAAGGIDVGKARPVDLLSPRAPRDADDVDPSRIENYRAAIAALNAQLAESESPTRASGSNENTLPAEIDDRTKAKFEELKKQREARQKELDEAKQALNDADAAAGDDKKALAGAREVLQNKKTDLRVIRSNPNASASDLGSAKKAVDEAQKIVNEKSVTEKMKALGKARGVADVKQSALDESAGVVPGGSLRITAASSRFVSMKQDFASPLIIGYHGFDCEIRYSTALGIHLGPPVATQRQVLNDGAADTEQRFSSNNEPRAIELRKGIRATVAPQRVDEATQILHRLFPDSAIPYGAWLQSATVPNLERFMREMGIEVPTP